MTRLLLFNFKAIISHYYSGTPLIRTPLIIKVFTKSCKIIAEAGLQPCGFSFRGGLKVLWYHTTLTPCTLFFVVSCFFKKGMKQKNRVQSLSNTLSYFIGLGQLHYCTRFCENLDNQDTFWGVLITGVPLYIAVN